MLMAWFVLGVCLFCLCLFFLFFFFFFSNRHLALSLKKCLTACDKALSIPQSFSVISAVGGVRWYGELHWNANLSCYLLFKLSWQDPPPQPKQNKNPSFFFSPFLSVAQVSTPSGIQETVEGPPESHSSINESHLLVMLLGSDSALMQCP